MSNKAAGAAGSHNAVDIEFTFNASWENTSKKVYFFNAKGLNPVVKLLLPEDINADGRYQISIPSEPLEFAGKMRMTVKGYAVENNVTERVMMSASFDFDVLEATLPETDTEPADITPTQAEQFLTQLDEIKADIVTIDIGAVDAKKCTAAAEGAAESAKNAAKSAASAKNYAELAEEIAGGDFPTRTEAEGYVNTHNGAEDAHSVLFAAKIDKVSGALSGNMPKFGLNGALLDSGLAFSVVNGVLTVTYDDGE